MQHNTDPSDEKTLARIASETELEFVAQEGEILPSTIVMDGVDVTRDIRSAVVDGQVSAISAIPAVREALVKLQRKFGLAGDYVVEGRDNGTVVLPGANVKIFLTASAQERARRRVKQNSQRGIGSTNFEEVLTAIEKRDQIDSSRDTAPLTQAPDALFIDSSDMTINGVVDAIVAYAAEHGFQRFNI